MKIDKNYDFKFSDKSSKVKNQKSNLTKESQKSQKPQIETTSIHQRTTTITSTTPSSSDKPPPPFLAPTSTSTSTSTPMQSPFQTTPQTQSRSQPQAEQPSPPSLSRPNDIINQYSLIFTLKRVLHPLLLTPILLFTITPLLLSTLISTFNTLSNDNAVLTFAIAYGVIYYLKYNVVRQFASSVEKYERAISSFAWYRLEVLVLVLVSFVVSSISNRLALIQVEEQGQVQEVDEGTITWMKYFQTAGFMNLGKNVGWRVLFSFLLLSLLIGSRFIGYFSIVQCSSYPLPNNPYLVIMNNLLSYITNFHQVLQPDQQQQQQRQQQYLGRKPLSTTSPSSSSSSSTSSSTSSRFSICKRYSKPSIPQTTIQIILHLFGGFLFGLILLQSPPPPVDGDGDTTICDQHHDMALAMKYLFLVSCAFTSAFVFMVTYFNGSIKYNLSSNTIAATTTGAATTVSFSPIPIPASSTVQISNDKKNHHYNHHEIAFNYKTTLPYVSSLMDLVTKVVYTELIDKLYLSSALFYWIISPLLGIGLINVVMKVVNMSSTNSSSGSSSRMNLFLFLFSSSSVGGGTCSSDEYSAMQREFILTLLRSYGVTLAMCLYMIGTDIHTRKFLMTCGVDVHNLISQSNIVPVQIADRGYDNGKGSATSTRGNDGSVVREMEDMNEIAVEDVVVSIILAGLGRDILEDVASPRLVIGTDGHVQSGDGRKRGGGTIISSSTTASWAHPINDIEEEEVRRNSNMMERVARSILSGVLCGHTTFSEDLLKFVLLESLGGGGDDEHAIGRSKPSHQERCDMSSLGLSQRHYNTLVQYLASTHHPSQLKGTLSIVRALCAYTGGMGKALSYIAAASPTGRSFPTRMDTFTLPPCACQSVTNAMKAAARLVILNMNPSKQTNFESGAIPARNRLNQLSWFIPVILHSIYNLRCGVLEYAQYLFSCSDPLFHYSQKVQMPDSRRETFGNFLVMKHPEMAQVLEICDSWAIKMQQYWKKVDGFDAGVNLDEDVKDWIKSLT